MGEGTQMRQGEIMVKDVIVLGGGSAGLLAALSLKAKMPHLDVTIVRSVEMGTIRVGESTTPNFPRFLFDYLKIKRRRFYELVRPTWKKGIQFLWGPRGRFLYTFDAQTDSHSADLPRPNGFYCDEDFSCMSVDGALLGEGKAFVRQANGSPGIRDDVPFHLDNARLVAALETFCMESGVRMLDGKMKEAQRGPEGIAALVLEDGRRMAADLFIDASGFRSELLGRALGEPFVSYEGSLFNDRAMVGGWDRTNEPIMPYTTAETMDAGWCWTVEHEDHINRGYVYCSGFISDEKAREEFARKNPKATIREQPLKFRSGRYQRAWVGNVMAIGNACGFVEPLESTALMVTAGQCETFTDMIHQAGISPTMRDLFNEGWACDWDEIRDFLTLHFWPNTLLDTPYWKHCNADADISRLKPMLEFYRENGPTGFARRLLRAQGNQFGIEGFLVMLVGNKIPYDNRHVATERELQLVAGGRARYRVAAQQGVDVREALAYIRHPNWRWKDD